MYFSFFISPLDFYIPVYQIFDADIQLGTKYLKTKKMIFWTDSHRSLWNEFNVP